MDNLNKILQRCKCGVYLTVNEHRDDYESVEEYMAKTYEDLDKDVFQKMCEADTIIELQFYPDTPTSCYRLFHYNLEAILQEAVNILEEQRNVER